MLTDELRARLASLCTAYVEAMEQMKTLEEERQRYKSMIYAVMKELNVHELILPDGEDAILKVTEHKRTTKSFDKAAFAYKLGIKIEDCDQKGIAKEVEEEHTNSEEVGEFLVKNKSEFIIIRRQGLSAAQKLKLLGGGL